MLIVVIPHRKPHLNLNKLHINKVFVFYFVSTEVATKGPQNVVCENFHSSMDLLEYFEETPRVPGPAADFQHKPGKYIFLKCMAKFAIPFTCLLK